ncbi:Rv3235 family protein [Streptomyces sp. NPDC048324]|uniref:Rv3235 family protein n=1 Tax=Streptomyces sp. NPDC048324 TaxID=3157205 RepID=UPI003435040F
MHKVMTRTAQRRPGSRPPARQDSRRPAGAPPRTPGGSPARTAPGDGRPPRPRATGTGPGDSRPPTAPAGTAAVTRTTARTAPAPQTLTIPARQDPPAQDRPGTGTPDPTVPAQARRLPPAQPRPTDVFADLLLAVLSGQRPVHSMLRHTAGRAYDELAWLAERGPLRARGTRPVVRDIGYYEARPGAVEVFARIAAGDQLRAMAFRLERGHDLRWRCTAVELGGARPPLPADDA